ncbi:hypothetical protein NDU88_000768 [Pleurodeles waltl]|uniref:Uncharacterized protein n=1 Tax=Pleurodeles waltl TaxID=8319 RepID=A0AAV7P4P7_PLEWA|nr:hypothetical protein NDU88_000768 [Pleurodeles waltl]
MMSRQRDPKDIRQRYEDTSETTSRKCTKQQSTHWQCISRVLMAVCILEMGILLYFLCAGVQSSQSQEEVSGRMPLANNTCNETLGSLEPEGSPQLRDCQQELMEWSRLCRHSQKSLQDQQEKLKLSQVVLCEGPSTSIVKGEDVDAR